MADEKKTTSSKKVINEYGQTAKEYADAHGGRDPEPEPDLAVDEKHQKAKKEARWG